jgi:hypothetical protein
LSLVALVAVALAAAAVPVVLEQRHLLQLVEHLL